MSGRVKALTTVFGVMLIGGVALWPSLAAAQSSALDNCLNESGDAALAACNAAIRENPHDAEAYHGRGSAFVRKGQYDRAIADYNEAIKLSPEYAMPYFNRGLILENKSQLQQALSDFNRSAELDPSDNDSKKAIARVTAALRGRGSVPASAPSRWSLDGATVTKWIFDLRNLRGPASNNNANIEGDERRNDQLARPNDATPNQSVVETQEYWNDQMARANGGSSNNRRINALERLGELRSSGILTNQEYEREKRRVMDE